MAVEDEEKAMTRQMMVFIFRVHIRTTIQKTPQYSTNYIRLSLVVIVVYVEREGKQLFVFILQHLSLKALFFAPTPVFHHDSTTWTRYMLRLLFINRQ